MPSEWRYALKPLSVDPGVKKTALSILRPKRIEAFQRERQASSMAQGSAEERTRRIVRALRARESQPDPPAQERGPDDDPSTRN
jgi:hypothetical protein